MVNEHCTFVITQQQPSLGSRVIGQRSHAWRVMQEDGLFCSSCYLDTSNLKTALIWLKTTLFPPTWHPRAPHVQPRCHNRWQPAPRLVLGPNGCPNGSLDDRWWSCHTWVHRGTIHTLVLLVVQCFDFVSIEADW